MAFELLCYVTVVFIALYYYFTAKFNFWKDRSVRGPKPIPVFGNIFWPMIGKISIGEYLQKLHNEYKDEPMIGLFVRRTPYLIIQDPELIKDVLIKDFSKFANRGFLKQEIAEPLSQHLFSLEVERWRPLRMQLSPVFTSGKLKGIFSLIFECAKRIENYLDISIAKGEPIEVRELAARYTTDVIGSCAFGIDVNSLSDKESEFRQMGKEIFATHWKAVLKFRMKECMGELYDLLGYILPPDKVNVFIERITIETLNYRKEHNIVRRDFMNTLLELRNNPEKIKDIKLTDTLLAAQAFVFFAAGFETSSTTISNALYELALNQEIQKKLREEIKEFDEKNAGDWKYETIKQMSYLDKVFKETLRKYPALAFISRETTDNYTFSNTKVSLEKCMKVWIPVFSIHRDPNIYSDPDKFDPERFSKEAVDARHPMHYLPFGHGPRSCIGARFAIYQTKIGLIKILHNYEVHVCEKTPIPYELDPFAFIISAKGGLYLNIIKSKNKFTNSRNNFLSA